MTLLISNSLQHDAQTRALLRSLLLVSVASTATLTLISAAMSQRWFVFALALTLSALLGASAFALREASLARARVWFVGALTLCFVAAYENGGIRSPHFFGSVSLVYTAALIFGTRGALGALLGTVVIGAGLVALEISGLLPLAPVTSLLHSTVVPLTTFAMAALTGAWLHQRLRQLTRMRDDERLTFERTAALLETEIKLRSHAQKELSRAYDAALEGTRVKTSFLANMSHELRTPMNAVVGLTDLMLRDELTQAQRENLETVRESSNGLLVLLDDLLDLSKIDAGAMRLEHVEFSVREVMLQLERLLAPKAVAKHIALRFIGADALPALCVGDPYRLTQVMTNLIGNSLKFTDSGAVTVTVTWSDPHLKIAVADTGIGMTADQLTALFQPFTQVDASTTRRFGGTGLGLAIVKRLCELHHGEVTVSSELGVGSVFTAVLRYQVGHAEALTQKQSPRPVQPLDGLRVLVAEDNRINQRVAERLLERLGVTCQVVNNGAEALEHLTHTQWDVVLMDIQMPVMDGIEATRRIRAQSMRQPTIIALSANAMDEDKTTAKTAGVDAFLSKPITLDALADALHRARSLETAGVVRDGDGVAANGS